MTAPNIYAPDIYVFWHNIYEFWHIVDAIMHKKY